jgi:CRP/FNR family cyclic AMP-dependent transcriptional regulator
MEKDDLTEIMRQHPFLAGLQDEHMKTVIGCASNVRFVEGAHIIHEGQIANKFFMIRTGRVALEIGAPGRENLRIQTVGPGEILGWSWLISPCSKRVPLHLTASVCGTSARMTRCSATRC